MAAVVLLLLLQDLNPFPFAVALVCTATWVAYGFAARDYNMFFCNIPGLAIGLYTSITTYPYASRRVRAIWSQCSACKSSPLSSACTSFAAAAAAWCACLTDPMPNTHTTCLVSDCRCKT